MELNKSECSGGIFKKYIYIYYNNHIIIFITIHI